MRSEKKAHRSCSHSKDAMPCQSRQRDPLAENIRGGRQGKDNPSHPLEDLEMEFDPAHQHSPQPGEVTVSATRKELESVCVD